MFAIIPPGPASNSNKRPKSDTTRSSTTATEDAKSKGLIKGLFGIFGKEKEKEAEKKDEGKESKESKEGKKEKLKDAKK